jgi:hypothetical protein
VMRQWQNLDERERGALRAALAFLNGRLEERDTIEWALALRQDDIVAREAIERLIDVHGGQKLTEPWMSAWRLIEEFWQHTHIEYDHDSSVGAYGLRERIRAGEHSGSLVDDIAKLVAPRIKIEPFSQTFRFYKAPPKLKKPRKIADLFSVGLTSGTVVDPSILEIDKLEKIALAQSLATKLDAVVNHGLDLARRIGWGGQDRMWELGGLERVYYVIKSERDEDDHEPDEFHRGIAPSVKLLHAVLKQLARIDPQSASLFVRRWKFTDSPVHMRLWSAISFDQLITSGDEIGVFILSLDDLKFWDLHNYPEIAELRARRFNDINLANQTEVVARIRKRPPRSRWPKLADAKEVASARLYWAVRELRRIELANGRLPPDAHNWLAGQLAKFPDLAQMSKIDEGFLGTPKAQWVEPSPDRQFDELAGEARLKALDAALSSTRSSFSDNRSSGAHDWIAHQNNSLKILLDFESTSEGGAAFPNIWERFGWAHSPPPPDQSQSTQRDPSAEATRVLSLLLKLPISTVGKAIRGISHWLSTWEKRIAPSQVLPVWLRLWPVAVSATNSEQPPDAPIDLNTVARNARATDEPRDFDTLNSPAGKLVGVFLAACPNLNEVPRPFDTNNALRIMRDAVSAEHGRSGLIAKHRMTESLSYFLRADPAWTRDNLIKPLISDAADTRVLWRAVARRTQVLEVLKGIGPAMAERATDLLIGRETRKSLVFSLAIEALHALMESRTPAVPFSRITQMIRALDDEVRAHAAQTVQRFVRDSSSKKLKNPLPPEQVFRTAARPFLETVWPQERSLVSPGMSKAFADLPATSRGAFTEAVDAIERFLVPFDCWSMLDYGLYGDEEGVAKLSTLITPENAAAFLRLLDLTIGTQEGSVVPFDLASALDRIRTVDPELADDRPFRRLATVARRV